jgi:hypothetical protein
MTDVSNGPPNLLAVQTSTDGSTWTTRDWVVFEVAQGIGPAPGAAAFRLEWGDAIKQAGASSAAAVTETTGVEGLYCRVLEKDPAGTVVISSVNYNPVWWGKILAPDASQYATSGQTTYRATSIESLFFERGCWLGRALVTGSTFSIAFKLAPFNRYPAGDRSGPSTTGSVGGKTIYLHDATRTDTGNRWTARDIIDYLMACNFRHEHPPTITGSGQAGLDWAISDPTGCLSYDAGPFDARGVTLGEVLNDLAGPKRGLTWWCTVSGTTITVNIASGLSSAITIGTTTVPANASIWDQTDDGDPWLWEVSVREIADQVADEIYILGEDGRTIGISLDIYGSGTAPWTSNAASALHKGWTDSAETAANTWLDTRPATPRRAAYKDAWYRFALKPVGWNGAQYGSSGMPDFMVTATSAAYGTVGYDGTVGRLGASTLPAGWYEAAPDLPCAIGFTALNVGPRQPPVIVAEDFVAGTWIDHSEDWSIGIETSPPAVVLNDGNNGEDIRALLRDGRKIVVSIGLKDFLPLQVSWRRDPANWPTNMPRTKVIRRAYGHEYLLSGMVTGAPDNGGALTTTGGVVTTRDDLPAMRALLAHARAFYEEPYSVATFTSRAEIDFRPAYGVGTLLGSIIDTLRPATVNAMVVRRTIRLNFAAGEDGVQVPYWTTTWETDVVYPDLEIL